MTKFESKFTTDLKTCRAPTRLSAAVAATLAVVLGGVACADETVNIGGSNAVVLRPKAPHGSVILMPGGSGAIAAGPEGPDSRRPRDPFRRPPSTHLARGGPRHG